MPKNSFLKICLDDLQNGHPGISSSCGSYLGEAAKVCFDNQKHISDVRMSLSGISKKKCEVVWNSKITDQIKRTWNDMQETTEYGACGVAVLLILELTEYTVIERSRKGTGFDYWLGYKNTDLPFQNSARLEVSGILKGTKNAFDSRIKQKKKQTLPTDNSNFPAYIVVVEFGEPKAAVEKK